MTSLVQQPAVGQYEGKHKQHDRFTPANLDLEETAEVDETVGRLRFRATYMFETFLRYVIYYKYA